MSKNSQQYIPAKTIVIIKQVINIANPVNSKYPTKAPKNTAINYLIINTISYPSSLYGLQSNCRPFKNFLHLYLNIIKKN